MQILFPNNLTVYIVKTDDFTFRRNISNILENYIMKKNNLMEFTIIILVNEYYIPIKRKLMTNCI